MSKWIDAEWIRNVYADFEHYDNRNDWTTPIANVLAVIDGAPSIDIVRCKECRYWEMRNSPRGWCVVHQGYVSPQYFCADGERKE